MFVAAVTCSECAAPLALGAGQEHVICVYCRRSLRVASARTGVRIESEPVAPGDIERVTRLILDGKHGAAVAHYARAAQVSRGVAEAAVTGLELPELSRVLRGVPLTRFGIVLGATLLVLALTTAGWAFSRVADGGFGHVAVLVVAAFVSTSVLLWLLPKAWATFVARFGTVAKAKIVQRTLLRAGVRPGASIVLVLLEVEPLAGGRAFYVQQALLVQDRAIGGFEPGSLLYVRFREPGRARVFPVSPNRAPPTRTRARHSP